MIAHLFRAATGFRGVQRSNQGRLQDRTAPNRAVSIVAQLKSVFAKHRLIGKITDDRQAEQLAAQGHHHQEEP